MECYKNDAIMKARRAEKKWRASTLNSDLILNSDLKRSDLTPCN